MTSPRYVTDHEFFSFREVVPLVVASAMDLALLTGHDLAALLALTWKSVKAFGLPREQWAVEIERLFPGHPKSIYITADIETALKACKMMKPLWPREFVLRGKDGLQISEREFKAIWRKYMRRWVEVRDERTAFSFSDIRLKALSDQQDTKRVSRRRTPRTRGEA